MPDRPHAGFGHRDPGDDGLLSEPGASAGLQAAAADAPGAAALPDQFFRHQAGRLVAYLTARFGARHLARVEDAVQTALLQAVSTWARDGVPREPAAWLTRVASHRLLDDLRHLRRAPFDLTGDAEGAALSVPATATALDERPGGPLDDDLRLLFALAHEAVPDRTRLVLCLKLVCGFSTREIARRLFTSEANAQKQLERGREALAKVFRPLDPGDLADLTLDDLVARLPLVEHVVYLLFNEGYSSERRDAPLRPDLCDDALRLGELLAGSPGLGRASTAALLSLMHFHRARLDARVGDAGELLLLCDQDRSRWDTEHLRAGRAWLERAGEAGAGEYSRYHGEALILAEHCLAPSFDETRWSEIVELYELLERAYPNPLYVLNRAVALAEWRGPEAGLALLAERAPARWLAGYYLFDATLGELERRRGDFSCAVRHLERAAASAPTRAERRNLERKLERARAGDPGR